MPLPALAVRLLLCLSLIVGGLGQVAASVRSVVHAHAPSAVAHSTGSETPPDCHAPSDTAPSASHDSVAASGSDCCDSVFGCECDCGCLQLPAHLVAVSGTEAAAPSGRTASKPRPGHGVPAPPRLIRPPIA